MECSIPNYIMRDIFVEYFGTKRFGWNFGYDSPYSFECVHCDKVESLTGQADEGKRQSSQNDERNITGN